MEPSGVVSLLSEAAAEAERHKWIESEKRGYDVGQDAIDEWYRTCWRGFVRARLVSHLEGHRRYLEFGEASYGIVNRFRQRCPELVNWLLEQLRHGAENLEILVRAQEAGFAREELIELLTIADLNAWQFPPVEVSLSAR